MAENLVKFVTGLAAEFMSLEPKDENTLYFITDERRIYKGNEPFSGGIYKAIEEYPERGELNTIYVNTTDGSVKYWNGNAYQEIVKPVSTIIEGTGDDLHFATTKAIVDYISTQLQNFDLSAITNRLDAIEGQITIINGSGEGSISKALQDAKDYADGLSSNYAPATHSHTLSQITDAGDLAGKDEVTESDLETTLASKINNKADKATTLSGYGITDAYTKEETNSAISSAVANAEHLKREIVAELPQTSEADENTIYMVGPTGEEPNQKYEEFMLINGAFEKIGDSAVDLTNYATKEYVDQAKSDAISTAGTNTDSKISEKVGAIDGTVKDYVDSAKSSAIGQITTEIEKLDVTDSAVANQYVSQVSQTDGKISVQRVELPVKSVTVGTENGTISVNGEDVAVTGLKSAAFTESSAYATAAQGAKADTALQASSITEGTTNGAFNVNGTPINIHGLGSAAYENTSAFDANGAANTALTNAKAYVDEQIALALSWNTLS